MGRILGFRYDERRERARDADEHERAEIVIFPRESAASVVETWEAINRNSERYRRRPLSDA